MAEHEDFYIPGQVDEQIDQLLLNDIPSMRDQRFTRALQAMLRDDEDQQSLNHVLNKLHDKRNESFTTDTNIVSLPHRQRKSVSSTMTQRSVQLKRKPKTLPRAFTLFAACFVVVVVVGSLLLVLNSVQHRKDASSNIAYNPTQQSGIKSTTSTASGNTPTPAPTHTPTPAPTYTPGDPSSSVIVSTGKVPTYQSVGDMETVLTTLQGITLYVHKFQGASGFSCDGSCAQTWFPLVFRGTDTPVSTTKLPGKLSLGTDAQGRTIVLYQGYPLYTNVGDKAPGQYNGRGADNSPWEAAVIDIPPGL